MRRSSLRIRAAKRCVLLACLCFLTDLLDISLDSSPSDPELSLAEPELLPSDPELSLAEPELLPSDPELWLAEPELSLSEPLEPALLPTPEDPSLPELLACAGSATASVREVTRASSRCMVGRG